MDAYNQATWVHCAPSAHKTRKRPNCPSNPNCLFGFGAETNAAGVWRTDVVPAVLGPDPRTRLKASVVASLENEADDIAKKRRDACTSGGEEDTQASTQKAKPKKKRAKKPRKRGGEDDEGPVGTEAPHKTGLGNLGATCYINCLLQALFHNAKFCQSLYKWRRPKEVFIKEMTAGTVKQLDILESIQKLFGRMALTVERYVTPLDLVELLEVSKTVQQDVQEFNKLLLAYIDKALCKTAETHEDSAAIMAEAEAFSDARVARRSRRQLDRKAQMKKKELAPQLDLGRLIPRMFSGVLVCTVQCIFPQAVSNPFTKPHPYACTLCLDSTDDLPGMRCCWPPGTVRPARRVLRPRCANSGLH